MYLRTGWCSTMAPVDGATSTTPCLSSRGRMASVCGVPRLRNRAETFLSSISVRAFSAASLGSNLSSREISSIFWPLTPPLALMACDVQQCAVGGLLHPGGDLAAKTCRRADQDLGMAGCTGRQRQDQARRPQLPLFCHGGLLLFCVEAAV